MIKKLSLIFRILLAAFLGLLALISLTFTFNAVQHVLAVLIFIALIAALFNIKVFKSLGVLLLVLVPVAAAWGNIISPFDIKNSPYIKQQIDYLTNREPVPPGESTRGRISEGYYYSAVSVKDPGLPVKYEIDPPHKAHLYWPGFLIECLIQVVVTILCLKGALVLARSIKENRPIVLEGYRSLR